MPRDSVANLLIIGSQGRPVMRYSRLLSTTGSPLALYPRLSISLNSSEAGGGFSDKLIGFRRRSDSKRVDVGDLLGISACLMTESTSLICTHYYKTHYLRSRTL